MSMNPDELLNAYKYFSHHIRTTTSSIVALTEAMQDGLMDDTAEVTELVAQSGFLLDLFDRGMSATFRYLVTAEIDSRDDETDIGKLIQHLLDKTCVLSEVPDTKFELDIDTNFKVHNNAYIMKSIFLIMLYEAIKASSSKLVIKGKFPELSLKTDKEFTGFPEIIHIFGEMFCQVGIKLEYDTNSIFLRFNHENSDCR